MRLLWVFLLLLATAAPGDEVDVALLKKHLPATDDAALLDFLKLRSLALGEQGELRRLVQQLGSDDFDVREKAAQFLPRYGATVVPLLREGLKSDDLEIARRSRLVLDEIQAGPGPLLPTSVLREVARRRPPGAEAVLLRYIVYADDAAVEEETVRVLLTLCKGRPLDPAIAAALPDRLPARRGVAAYLLARVGTPEQRLGATRALRDTDPGVRFRAAQGLVEAQERAGVPVLIDLLGSNVERWAWRAEELLLRLAGDRAPDTARGNRVEIWTEWWREHGATVDLARATQGTPHLGLTVVICTEAGTVWECGRDGKPRWKLTDLAGPVDAQVLEGNRVLVAEAGSKRVTERDLRGNILWKKELDQLPCACRRLPNGNVFIATYTGVMEVRRDGSEVYHHDLKSGVCNNHGIYAAQTLTNGNALVLTRRGMVIEVTPAGRAVRTQYLPGHGCSSVEPLPGGGFLIVQSQVGKVFEHDAQGQVRREHAVAGITHATRLPSGNTLVTTRAENKVLEIDTTGKILWELAAEPGLSRVYRR